jgi:hypothetical protein
VILAWYSLEANKDRNTNSSGDMVTDKRRELNERKRILGTPCGICLRLSSTMKRDRMCEDELDDIMSWEAGRRT